MGVLWSECDGPLQMPGPRHRVLVIRELLAEPVMGIGEIGPGFERTAALRDPAFNFAVCHEQPSHRGVCQIVVLGDFECS